MRRVTLPHPADDAGKIARLIETLHRTEQRLEELTAGQVDTVVDSKGRTFLLRRAQEELRSSEGTKQAAIINALPAHIALLDTEGNIVSVNESWRQPATANFLQGPDLDAGRNYIKICESTVGGYSMEAQAAARGIRQVLAGGTDRFAMEYSCHTPKEKRWFRLQVTPLHRDRQAGAVVMHVNITEPKLAQEVLDGLSQQIERRERILSTTLSSISDFAFILDQEGRFLFANQPLLNLLGLTLENAVGRNFAELGYPADLSGKLQEHVRKVFDTRQSTTDEAAYMNSAGLEGFHEYIFSPVFAADGAVEFVAGSARDVTERKHAEKEVAFNEQRYRSLVEATTAIVWDMPASGEFEVEQPRWTAFTGQSFKELRGWGWLNAVHPDDQSETSRAWSTAVAQRSTYKVEHRLRAADQSYRNMMVRAVPLMGDDGTIRQWIGIHTDITEHRKIEHQLLRSQRMEGIGTLAGGIAHDLNNVLAPIIMSLDLLKRKFPDRESQELLTIVSSSAQHGADMVQQVLSFARGVEGKRMEVHINHLLRDIEKIIHDTFLKNIQIQTVISHDLWTVLGDPTQLHQVLLNLCVNARDAMPNGGMLTLSAENVSLDASDGRRNADTVPGPYVFLQVEDRGTGMPADVIEKIFDPFFTTKEVGKGTGLGLSTSMAIVKSHGGFIQVCSEMGKGTKFQIYLPAQTEMSPESEAAQAAEMPRGNGEWILVIDDESSIRQITQRTLEAYGYNVIPAGSGPEALDIYESRKTGIAVVLTDMMMPVMDGPTIIRELRRLNPSAHIIAASGLSLSGHAPLDTKYFLPKPYTAETLLKVLRQILTGNS